MGSTAVSSQRGRIIESYSKMSIGIIDFDKRFVESSPWDVVQHVTAKKPTYGGIFIKVPHERGDVYYPGKELFDAYHAGKELAYAYSAGKEIDPADAIHLINPSINRDRYSELFTRSCLPTLDIRPPVPASSFKPHHDLEAALEDLKECQDEAREQDFPTPTEAVLHNAERLLKAMFALLPRRFEVYPMPNGAIAIQASQAPKIAISVLCEPDGGALCLVSAPDHSRRAWYSKAEVLPDGFLYDALDALKSFEG